MILLRDGFIMAFRLLNNVRCHYCVTIDLFKGLIRLPVYLRTFLHYPGMNRIILNC